MTIQHDGVLEHVLEKLERLEAEVAELRAEKAALASGTAPSSPPAGAGDEEPISRRGLLRRLGTVGAAGAGAALVAGTVGARPAYAGTDGDVVLGRENRNAAGTGLVDSSNGQSVLYIYQQWPAAFGSPGLSVTVTRRENTADAIMVFNNGSGEGVRSFSSAGNGVAGSADAQNRAGVFGYNQNPTGGWGVIGRSDGPAGIGVAGYGAGNRGVHGESSKGTGVSGVSANGNAVTGETTAATNGFNGVYGVSRGTGNGVFGETVKTDAAGNGVLGMARGSGNSVFGFKPNGVGGDAVVGLSRTGKGVWGISDTGIGVQAVGGRAPLLLTPSAAAGSPTTGDHKKGEVYTDTTGVLWLCTVDGTPGTWVRAITTGANTTGTAGISLNSTTHTLTATSSGAAANAVFGRVTNAAGTGAALRGVSNGTGHAIVGLTTAAANVSAAVLGQGSTGGRGGKFQGGKAQIQLVPAAGAHPASGEAGDLFLDNLNNLYLCKGGTTWVRLG